MDLATKPGDKPNHDYKGEGERGDFGKLGGRQTPKIADPPSRHHSSSHRTMSRRRTSSPMIGSQKSAPRGEREGARKAHHANTGYRDGMIGRIMSYSDTAPNGRTTKAARLHRRIAGHYLPWKNWAAPLVACWMGARPFLSTRPKKKPRLRRGFNFIALMCLRGSL